MTRWQQVAANSVSRWMILTDNRENTIAIAVELAKWLGYFDPNKNPSQGFEKVDRSDMTDFSFAGRSPENTVRKGIAHRVLRLALVGALVTLSACGLPRGGPSKGEILSGSIEKGGSTNIVYVNDQVIRAAEAGADIVRISAPDQETTRALREICRESPVPIVADIHFHYKRAIEAAEAGAACLRINPGNIGDEARVREVIRAALQRHTGNWAASARELGLDRANLHRLAVRLGLK